MVSDYDRLMTVLFAKADTSKSPLSGSFELTSRCTLDCKMCYIHRRENDKSAISGEKDTAFWIDLARKAKDAGTLLLLLTGGEPMVRSDFDEIYLECKKLGLLVSVNTNATLIDEQKLRLFTEYPPLRLNITLYGTSRETYANLCGNADAYDRVANAIHELKKVGVNMKLNFSITPYNSADAAKAQELAKELDLPVQSTSYMFSPVRASGETVRLSAKDAAKAHFEWKKRQNGDADFKSLLQKSLPDESCDIMCGEKINCRAGLSSFWVTWQGEMTPCGMMTAPSAPAEDFSEAWKTICAEREKIYLPKKCATCRIRNLCDLCAAVSVAETGKSDAVPQYACEKAREYARLCREYINSG